MIFLMVHPFSRREQDLDGREVALAPPALGVRDL
jgi:hypothetical protein